MSKASGQSLVEMIVAIAVMMVVVVSLISVATTSLRNASFSRDQALATKYAQDAIENVRSQRNQNPWDSFATECININCGTILSGISYPSPFTLTCGCNCPDPDMCEVTVNVSWADTKGTHKSELTTRLTNWK